MNVLWSTVAHEFTSDGSLRDIYVFPSTVSDWQSVLEFVRHHSTDPSYTVDGEPAAWPASAADVFATRAHASPALWFRFGGIHFAAHFFTEAEVEFDFHPNDVRSQPDLDSLLSFLRQVGDLLAKPISVTPENSMGDAFLVYQPDTGEFRITPSLTNRYA